MKISTVIVTRNRAAVLQKCLNSLAKQSVLPQEILVVDNDSSDKTKETVLSFKKRLPIRYVLEKKVGYPFVYNRGLKEARGDVVAFIDDDCVARKDWVKEIKKAFKKFPAASVIEGNSLNYYLKNPFSCVVNLFVKVWQMHRIDKKSLEILDYSILDNKNVAYKLKDLLTHKIFFNEKLIKELGGIGEDCDFGLRIQQKGLKAFYWSKMIVWHKEPDNLPIFLKKTFYEGGGKSRYEDRWRRHFISSKFRKIDKKIQENKSILGKVRLVREIGRELSFSNRVVYLFLVLLYKPIFNFGYHFFRLKIRLKDNDL